MTDAGVGWRSARRVVPVVLLVVVVALVVAAGMLTARLIEARRLDAARADAVQAARQESVNLASLDYKRIDADIRRVLAGATGPFHEEYADGADRLKEVVTKNEVRSTGTVLEAGVVSADSDSVTVLVVVDSTVRNKANQKGQLRHYRIQMEMSEQDGRWLTRNLQFVVS